MGRRAFSVAGPNLWNQFPDDIKNIELSVEQFKKKLKTHLFVEYFGKDLHQAQWVYIYCVESLQETVIIIMIASSGA